MSKIWKKDSGFHGDYSTRCPSCEKALALNKVKNCGRKVTDYELVVCLCHEPKKKEEPSRSPAADPTTLGGRKVDGWGWKVFWLFDERLYSENAGLGYDRSGPGMATERWLGFRGLQIIKTDDGIHIFHHPSDAKRWINEMWSSSRSKLVVRKVGWRRLLQPVGSLTYPPEPFRCDIFTAEEIYILPEEGVLVKPARQPVPCPKCGGWMDSHATLCSCGADKPAERPPEKGDWVFSKGWNRPIKVQERRSDQVIILWEGTPYLERDVHVVRRAADRLRVGDKVSFGSKEGWVCNVLPSCVQLNFSAEGNVLPYRFGEKFKQNHGYFKAQDLTLVSPVFDRPAEKDC